MSDVPEQRYENHVLRTICIILVMFVPYIHYAPDFEVFGHQLWRIVYNVGRFAMPIFFLISGYFLYSSDGHSEAQLKRKTLHIVFLFVFIKILYTVIDIILCICGRIDPDPGNMFTWAREPWGRVLYNFLLFGDSSAHIWFVASLALIYAGHWLFHKKHIDFKYLMPLGVGFLLMNLIIGELLPVFGVDRFGGQSLGDFIAGAYVTIGLFFFQAGYYLHKHRDWVDERFDTRKLALISLGSIVLMSLEIAMILNTGVYEGTASVGPSVYVGTIILAISLFLLTFKLRDDQLRCRPLEWMGKNVLAWMYAYIGFGVVLLKSGLFYDLKDNYAVYNIVGPILSILIQVGMSFLTFYILKRVFAKKETA